MSAVLQRRSLLLASLWSGGAWLLGQPAAAQDAATRGFSHWLEFAPDGTLTLFSNIADIGQGTRAVIAQIAAEELALPLSRIRVETAPLQAAFFNRFVDSYVTYGSMGFRTAYATFAPACAAARAMLLQAAAARLGSSDVSLVAPGEVQGGGRRIAYAELLADAARLTPPAKPEPKPRAQWTVLGRALPRQDLPDKVSGRCRYGIDEPAPWVATLTGGPGFGSRLLGVDAAPALAKPGVERVIELPDALAVVARSYWRALQGLQALKPRWQRGAALDSEAYAGELLQAVRSGRGDPFPARIDKQLDEGAAAIAWARAAQRIESEFELPFLAHAPLEPLNATAEWQGDAIEVWLSTQNPADTRAALAREFGLAEERVRLHQRPSGGGFGRRLEWDFVLQAARIAKALGPGKKVKTIWSREQDFASGHYRPACAIRARLALGTDGLPTGLRVDVAGGRIERSSGVKSPAQPDVPELATQMGWLRQSYAIPAMALRHSEVERGVPLAYWRSVGASQNSFAFEQLIDLAAGRAGQDPLAYRRRLLAAAPRSLAFVDALAAQAGWAKPLPKACFRGMAINEANRAISGHVVEIELLGARRFRIRRIVAGIDAGWVGNPDAVKAQLMGGTVFGLAATLFGEITFKEGEIQQRNFGDYRLPRLAELPPIELLLVEGGERPAGVGEEGVPTVAPALANALLAASGQPLSRLPLTQSHWQWMA